MKTTLANILKGLVVFILIPGSFIAGAMVYSLLVSLLPPTLATILVFMLGLILVHELGKRLKK